jgi:hypothetical protein
VQQQQQQPLLLFREPLQLLPAEQRHCCDLGSWHGPCKEIEMNDDDNDTNKTATKAPQHKTSKTKQFITARIKDQSPPRMVPVIVPVRRRIIGVRADAQTAWPTVHVDGLEYACDEQCGVRNEHVWNSELTICFDNSIVFLLLLFLGVFLHVRISPLKVLPSASPGFHPIPRSRPRPKDSMETWLPMWTQQLPQLSPWSSQSPPSLPKSS